MVKQKPNNTDLTLTIQAGGFSKRMGQDKALLPFNDKTLIEHIIDRGRTLTDSIIVTTNKMEDYRFLDIPLFSDTLPHRGTMIGLHTALSASINPFVAVIACDMPFFSPKFLDYQTQILRDNPSIDFVVPISADGFEPLHAVYRKETTLAAILSSIKREKFSLLHLFDLLIVKEIPLEKTQSFNPDQHIFMNLNTPDDYERAKVILKEN